MKYKHKCYILLSFLVILTIANCIAQQIAFPGAEGFGRFTTGGRGQNVYYVTNLNDAGAGSLRDALSAGNRTILFKVSGTIFLKSDLKVSKANTTIAGQSAPGDGICIANYTFRVEASNVIIRFIRCRLGDVTKYADDGMDGNGTSPSVTRSNIIVDHCSMGWCMDEAGSFYNNKNFTLQWCILSESLYHSYHPKGDHGYGGIWGGQGASFHHNLLAHHTSRNPRFCGSRYTGDSTHEIVDFRNNVIYNWGNINTAYGGEGGNYNIVNNYYKYGPATPNTSVRYRILSYTTMYVATDAAIYPDTVWGGKFYVNGNYVFGFATTTSVDNWTGNGTKPGVQIDNSAFKNVMARGKLTAPLTVDTVTTQSATDAFVSVVAAAGATMPRRDTIDRRISRETRTGTVTFGGHTYDSAYTKNIHSGIIDSQNDVGGWPTLNSRPYPTDADNDGMADEWETQRGLNPALATDRNGYNVNGYTHLENYLNGDSIVAVGTTNTCITAVSVTSSNTGLWLDLKDSSYQRLIATDTMNVVASIRDSATVLGNVNAQYYVSGITRLNTLGKPYLNRNITITSSVVPSGNFIVRLYITKNELNALMSADTSIKSISNLKVLWVADTTCNTLLNTIPTLINPVAQGVWGTYATGYYIDILTSKLGTYFFGSAGSVMPLNLISFKGINQNGSAYLYWVTSNEIEVDKFVVEKSNNGRAFDYLTTINATNSINNNSYSTIDSKLAKGVTYYRLKMMDKTGLYRYSNVVIVKEESELVKVIPNPAKELIEVSYGKLNSMANVKIYSVEGQLVLTSIAPANSTKTIINIASLSKGMYFLSLEDRLNSSRIIFMKE